MTIENFGGSQDQLNMIGRQLSSASSTTGERGSDYRDRERKISQTMAVEQAIAVRSTLADARGSIRLGYDTDSGSEKQDFETEKITSLRRQTSMDNVSSNLRNNIIQQHSKEKDIIDGDMTSINMINKRVLPHITAATSVRSNSPTIYDHDFDDIGSNNTHVNLDDIVKPKSATLPKQTTWQQQSANLQHNDNNGES